MGAELADPILNPGLAYQHAHDCSRIPLRSTPLKRKADTDTELWLSAVRAAESKKAVDILVLDLREVTSFTDYFVICSGSNSRQIQAISDEIGQQLKQQGVLPRSVEGYDNAEWILADYGDFIVHIFSERARAYYDLERLWRQARTVEVAPA
ncbi:MAG: ribosome silencing factor [Bryobacteraceae bacterium]